VTVTKMYSDGHYLSQISLPYISLYTISAFFYSVPCDAYCAAKFITVQFRHPVAM